MKKINLNSVLDFDIKLGSESYSFKRLNDILGEEKIKAKHLSSYDNLISRLNVNYNRKYKEQNNKIQLNFENELANYDLKTIENNITELKREMNNIKNDIDNIINDNLKSKFKTFYNAVGTLICNQNVLEFKSFLEKRERYIEDLKNNNYLNQVKTEIKEYGDRQELKKILENVTYKFTIRLMKNSYSKNTYHISYCLRFNSNTTFSDKRLKKVETSYNKEEKALAYIEGRIKYYKNKYFTEEQPKIEDEFVEGKHFSLDNIIQFNNSNLKLQGYN